MGEGEGVGCSDGRAWTEEVELSYSVLCAECLYLCCNTNTFLWIYRTIDIKQATQLCIKLDNFNQTLINLALLNYQCVLTVDVTQ